MKKKLEHFGIKKAYISNGINDDTIAVLVDFALSLNHRDVLWIREDSEPSDYPWFPEITQEQIDKWADGWYAVTKKHYLPRKELELEVLEIHEDSRKSGHNYKAPFRDLYNSNYSD